MRKKMLISIAIVFIMLLNCIAPILELEVAATTDSSLVLESNLYYALKSQLESKEINAIYNDAQRTLIISDEEIAKVTELSLSNGGLTDLTGLEVFTNVKALDLSSNNLTKDSNLEVLNSFELTSLDISSNSIEDVSMIANIKNIQNLNLHNQKFNVIEMVNADDTATSDQNDTFVYSLPQIVKEYAGHIESEWLVEENYTNNTQQEEGKGPYIDWRSFDYENLKVVYANKTDNSYDINTGMVKLSIKITDSKNSLYNSDINLYFVVVKSDERGIFIKDKNMYKAIKSQLTKGQEENEDLISHKDANNSKNLYERFFDEPQVLVITINDIINKIPSLKLSNKRISDITGIENFVGLELDLDLSSNYIKSMDKLIELEENQVKEEALLRERVNAQIALIKETVDEIEKTQAELKAVKENYDKKNEELNNLKAQLKQVEDAIKDATEKSPNAAGNLQTAQDTLKGYEDELNSLITQKEDLKDEIESLELAGSATGASGRLDEAREELKEAEANIEEKNNEIATQQALVKKYQEDVNNINSKIAEQTRLNANIDAVKKELVELGFKQEELTATLTRLRETLKIRMENLYIIYNRVDRLASFAVVGIRNMTDEEFSSLTFEEAKSLYDSQVSKIANMEDYLTSFEKQYLTKTKYTIETVVSVEIDGVTETKPIEKPISKHFSELPNDNWRLYDYKEALKSFKEADIYLAMYTYCSFANTLPEEKSRPDTCVADEYVNYIIRRLEIDRQDTKIYTDIKDSFKENCKTEMGDDEFLFYGKRMTLASAEEIEAYIFLPRLKRLNIHENLIEDIDRLAELSKLVEFYAGDNEIVDISKVDWTSINEHLIILDLSFNDISNIEPLEVLSNIQDLNLSKNLIEGELTFKIENLKKLKNLDLSNNQISDIQRLLNYLTYEARAAGFTDVLEYLRDENTFNLDLTGQQLELIVDGMINVGTTSKIDLPPIFQQIEKIDYANTSFAIDSIHGNVTSDGKQAIVDVSSKGNHVASVSITNTKNTISIGYGTTCVIAYIVGEPIKITVTPENSTVKAGETQQFVAEVSGENVAHLGVKWSVSGNTSENTKISRTGLLTVGADEQSENIEVIATSFYDNTVSGNVSVTVIVSETPVEPTDPTDPTEPTEPTDPTEPTEPTDPVTPIELGYTIDSDNDYLTGIKSKTPVEDFKSILLKNNNEYTAVVKNSDGEVTTGNIATGMFVQIQDKDGKVVKDSNGNLLVYEIVVKGDINGDGHANSIDTLLIKAHRNEVEMLSGTFLKAADINNDNVVDIKDSKLLLYHRAEVNGYNLDYTK